MSIKPKEWLLANGHIKAVGRGRMSREHIELIKGAVASGVAIEGYSTPKATSSEDKPAAKTPKPTGEFTGVPDVPEPLRDARDFIVVDAATGKPVRFAGPATVCNGCNSSFTYCGCSFPRMWLDYNTEVRVAFKYTGN